MTQPDLISQKILATDPQEGFGDAVINPYREHKLDTSGYEAMERVQARHTAEKAARQKHNEDNLQDVLKSLPTYQREFDEHLSNERSSILSDAHNDISNYGQISLNTQKRILNYAQKAKATDQLAKDVDEVKNSTYGPYINKDLMLVHAGNKYGDIAQEANRNNNTAPLFNESVRPNPNDPQYFMFDKYFNNKYGKRDFTETSKDEIRNGALGQEITGKKVKAMFTTKDANGNVIPGIDQSEINDNLYSPTTDPDTIQARNAIYSLADAKIRNKALQLMSDPEYAGMSSTQVEQSISSNPKDKHYEQFNRNKLAEDIVRSKIEPFQKVSQDESIRMGHAYKTGNGSGNTKEDINARHKSIQKIIENDPTEQGNLVGGMIGGKKIVGVELAQQKVKGSPVEASTKKGALKVANENLPGIIKFKVLDDDGKEHVVEVPYKDKKDLYYQLNNVYNTAPGQNKISKEELDKNRGNDPLEINNKKKEDPLGIF